MNICPVCYTPLHFEGACPSCGNFITFPRHQPTGREVIVGGLSMWAAIAMVIVGTVVVVGAVKMGTAGMLLFALPFGGFILWNGGKEIRRLMSNLR